MFIYIYKVDSLLLGEDWPLQMFGWGKKMCKTENHPLLIPAQVLSIKNENHLPEVCVIRGV